ncbi:MFS transporter [Acidianus sp. RZ1]|uniref:MFS transporter n=1 Tax=Acidianus sp. RZ1 TaxID=1540082 RepID=UPI00149251A1|nr:MFS transporter [Acidianus sp. RZ1]NON61356.1 MFS transporter [Acidianus sp. RZ1]
MKPLRTYVVIKNFALNLVQPFISFTSVISGILGEQLGLISSASSFLPSIMQFLLGFSRTSGKSLVVYGTVLSAIGWILLALVPFNLAFTLIYLFLESSLGISLFGWYLIMEKVSRTSRGKTLATYSFYSTLGGLAATLITGFIVGGRTQDIRYFFGITGGLILLDVYFAIKFDVDAVSVKSRVRKLPSEIKKYLAISFIFFTVWSLAWPLFPLAQYYIFSMNYFNIAIIDVISLSSTLVIQRWVGSLVDKNRKMMMFLGRLSLAAFPLAYALSTNIWEIYASQLVSGFTSSINSTAYLSYLYDSSDDVRKSLGYVNLVQGIAEIVGSSLGSILASVFIASMGIFGIRELLGLVGGLRIFASFLYLILKEPKPFKKPIQVG